MRFVINVKEFWLDEDENLEPALIKYITNDVIIKVNKQIQDKVDKLISEKVTQVIESRLAYVIDDHISKLIDAGIIVRNRQEISIVDHIKKLFEENHGWNNPDARMQAIAKKFGEELKLQYNNIFANRIVQNLKEQGFLKDDLVQVLLQDNRSA